MTPSYKYSKLKETLQRDLKQILCTPTLLFCFPFVKKGMSIKNFYKRNSRSGLVSFKPSKCSSIEVFDLLNQKNVQSVLKKSKGLEANMLQK